MRKRRAEDEAAAASSAYTSTSSKAAVETKIGASGLPVTTYDHTGRARSRPTVAVKQQKATAVAAVAATAVPQVHTSPLRRSPRRRANVVPNVRQPIGGKAALSQPFTSPTRPTNDEQTSIGIGSKRRKFTTALSAVALREELANSPDAQKLQEPPQPKKRRITPTNLSKSVPAPDRFKSPSFGSAAFANLEGGEDDFHFLGASASYCPSNTKVDIEKQKKHAKAIFDTASPKPQGIGRTNSDDTIKQFLMNASPGTAIRSLLGETPKLGKVSAGFGSVHDTPGKIFSKYLLDGLTLPAGLSSFDLPDIDASASKFNESNIDPALSGPSCSPSASSLSTPFRNAIFQTATSKTPAGPIAPFSPGKRISPRAASEQPPSAHDKFLATLHGPHGPSGLAVSQTMHLSSDDTNFGLSTSANPLINLLPPTADRSRSISTNLPMQGSEFTSDMPTSYSDALLDDFSSFLLKTSSSLFTSPSPPKKTSARPGLAIPGHGAAGRRHSTPTPLSHAQSSEIFDTDDKADDHQLETELRDLPPSSPPPLPPAANGSNGFGAGKLGQSSFQNYLDNFLAGFGVTGAEDTQSPISVGTSATQGGTPQESLTPFAAPQQNGLNAENANTVRTHYGSADAHITQRNESSETSYDVDMTLLGSTSGDKTAVGGDSFDMLGSFDEGVGLDDDPLLSFFGQGAKAANPAISKLKYTDRRVGGQDMSLSWSALTESSTTA